MANPKYFFFPLTILCLLVNGCSPKKPAEKPHFVGDYTVDTQMSVSIPGRDEITNSEVEHIKIQYVGGDTLAFSSPNTFAEEDIRGIFKDSSFTIIPYYVNSTERKGSGSISNGELSMNLSWGGVASADIKITGQKDDTTSDPLALSKAKALAKEITDNVARAERKEITQDQLSKETLPLQKKLDKLRLALPAKDRDELKAYTLNLLNKIVDRKKR